MHDKSEMMNSLLDKLKTSKEFYLLVLVSILYLYNITTLIRPDPADVHQFESFDELRDNTIDCSGDQVNELSNSNDSTRFERSSVCPIDGDRLRLFTDLELNAWLDYKHIATGGRFKPTGCRARQRVAIVIPYRNREEHLRKLSLYIHKFLPDQLIDYSVFVIEQTEGKLFNRAKVFNVGAKEILKLRKDICCFIFHDVDMLPLDQKNLYMCSHRPRHMSPSVNTLRFNLLYPELFGGVVAITPEQFESIGGFANHFYGWGGEDDDMFHRFRVAGYGIDRTPLDVGLYTMMRHRKMEPNPKRRQLIGSNQTSSDESAYKVESIEEMPLYTRILVDI